MCKCCDDSVCESTRNCGFKRFVRLCVSVAMILSVSLHVTLNAAGFRRSVGRGGSAGPVTASRHYTAGSAA